MQCRAVQFNEQANQMHNIFPLLDNELRENISQNFSLQGGQTVVVNSLTCVVVNSEEEEEIAQN